MKQEQSAQITVFGEVLWVDDDIMHIQAEGDKFTVYLSEPYLSMANEKLSAGDDVVVFGDFKFQHTDAYKPPGFIKAVYVLLNP